MPCSARRVSAVSLPGSHALRRISSLIVAAAVRADLPSPRLDRLFPLGAAAGSAVEVEVAGADLEEPKTLLLRPPRHHGRAAQGPQVQGDRRGRRARRHLRRPRGRQVRRQQPAAVRRVARADRSRREGAERRAGDRPGGRVNSAVNGTSDGNKDDVFRFPAKKGQRIVVECQAGKLDSQLDAHPDADRRRRQAARLQRRLQRPRPARRFRRPGRRRLLRQRPRPVVTAAGFPYRLVITDRPQVENVFPRAVQAGKPQTVTRLRPQPRAGVEAVAPGRSTTCRWTRITETVTPPADVLTRGLFRFTDHPTDAQRPADRGHLHAHRLPGPRRPAAASPTRPVTLRGRAERRPDEAAAAHAAGRGQRAVRQGARRRLVRVRAARRRAVRLRGVLRAHRRPGRPVPRRARRQGQPRRASWTTSARAINAFDGHLRDPSGHRQPDRARRSTACWCRTATAAAGPATSTC